LKKGSEKSNNILTINAIFVGGGKGCRDVLRLLTTYPLRRLKIHIIGVADPRPDAPGRVLAEEIGIKTADNYREFFKYPELDLVIELTGNDQVLEEIIASKPRKVKVLDHLGARLLWEIIEIQEDRLILEERLNAAEKIIAVGQLVYRVTHELRNPLMTIGGLTRRIILDPETPYGIRKQMEQIIASVEDMEKAITNICDEVQPIKPHFAPTDIVRAMKSWCKGLRYEGRRHNIEIRCVIEEDLPVIVMDKALIAQVLWHVVEFVMENMDKDCRKLLIQARLCLDEILIVIEQDDDIPVKPPYKGKKQQVQETDYTFLPSKHSHLWMALCRKIMFDHGGDIRIGTRGGKLLVILELPSKPAASEPVARQVEQKRGHKLSNQPTHRRI